MAKFTKQELYKKINDVPIVPLFTHAELEVAIEVVKTCYEGGIRVFEYTNRSNGAHKVFKGLVSYARKEIPDLAIGIGTIFNAEEAVQFIDLDADFIIQPMIDEGVAEVCKQNSIAWIPGAMTVREVYQAQQLGADIIKIFPANIVGSDFIKAIKGPISSVKLMATGGIEPTIKNLTEWFSAGAHCVGMGSQLFSKRILANKDYPALLELVSACVKFKKNEE